MGLRRPLDDDAGTTTPANGEGQPSGPSLVRVDGKTNQAEDYVIQDATARVRGLAIGEGAIWIPNSGAEQIFKFDPVAKKVVLTIPVHFSGTEGSVGVGEGQGDNSVQRIDPESGAVIGTIETGLSGGGGDITTGGGYVWLTLLGTPLVQIDPRTNAVVAVFEGLGWGDAIRFGGGSLWT